MIAVLMDDEGQCRGQVRLDRPAQQAPEVLLVEKEVYLKQPPVQTWGGPRVIINTKTGEQFITYVRTLAHKVTSRELNQKLLDA